MKTIDLPFKLEEFATFARQKPRDEVYDYVDTTNCPIGQFLRTLGLKTGYEAGQWSVSSDKLRYHNDLKTSSRASLPPLLIRATQLFPHTWGGLADRLGKVR